LCAIQPPAISRAWPAPGFDIVINKATSPVLLPSGYDLEPLLQGSYSCGTPVHRCETSSQRKEDGQ
jgi:hypothetical protein